MYEKTRENYEVKKRKRRKSRRQVKGHHKFSFVCTFKNYKYNDAMLRVFPMLLAIHFVGKRKGRDFYFYLSIELSQL
jgi:hypothetical protein